LKLFVNCPLFSLHLHWLHYCMSPSSVPRLMQASDWKSGIGMPYRQPYYILATHPSISSFHQTHSPAYDLIVQRTDGLPHELPELLPTEYCRAHKGICYYIIYCTSFDKRAFAFHVVILCRGCQLLSNTNPSILIPMSPPAFDFAKYLSVMWFYSSVLCVAGNMYSSSVQGKYLYCRLLERNSIVAQPQHVSRNFVTPS